MDRWEYMTCTYTNQWFPLLFTGLNKWGETGWELITCNTRQGNGITFDYECIFKRKKRDE